MIGVVTSVSEATTDWPRAPSRRGPSHAVRQSRHGPPIRHEGRHREPPRATRLPPVRPRRGGPRADRHRGQVPARRSRDRSSARSRTCADARLWLVGAHIPEYAQGNVANHDPDRDRKLLLHRREIDPLATARSRERASRSSRRGSTSRTAARRSSSPLARGKEHARQAPRPRRPRRQAPDRARAQDPRPRRGLSPSSARICCRP